MRQLIIISSNDNYNHTVDHVTKPKNFDNEEKIKFSRAHKNYFLVQISLKKDDLFSFGIKYTKIS